MLGTDTENICLVQDFYLQCPGKLGRYKFLVQGTLSPHKDPKGDEYFCKMHTVSADMVDVQSKVYVSS